MANKLRRIFCPTPEEQKEDLERYQKIHDELAKKRGALLVYIVFMFIIIPVL